MEDLEKVVLITKEIVDLAKSKGWSEKELAEAINLLHSHFDRQAF